MFSMNSLNTQNQLLINFTQITARYASLVKVSKFSKSKKNNVERPAANNVICRQSLEETLNNFDRNVLEEMCKLDLRSVATMSRVARNKVRDAESIISSKKVSFVSSESFEKNKNGWYNSSVEHIPTSPSGLRRFLLFTNNLSSLLTKYDSSLFSHHIRGFKTDRAIDADQKRNPNILNRLRTFGPNEKQQQGVETGPRIEKLLSDESPLQQHEKDKIKIAFAEGYLAGSSPDGGRGRKEKTLRYLKVVQQLLTSGLFLLLFLSLMSSLSGSGFRIQLGSQQEVDPEDIAVTFADVKGVDEAKRELLEVVEFLKNPARFSALGGKLPKGVLLVGPPGTGKTLLARAVAGEARVPFYHAAGAEFDEILVGQGARRVRDLFKAAKERAPCVVFIDEIDSVGAKRTSSVLHPYANQTINQLLSEMDGFHQNEGVIVLGATNRREDLDPALLRPGRFDVQVAVPAPDLQGRKDILALYLARVPRARDVDEDVLARATTGFTGADLETLVNQAALRAAIEQASAVSMAHLEAARDKVLMGPPRGSRLPDEEANAVTAYHEAGHALVAHFTRDAHPLHKVTIIPRGASLGHTAYIPSKERYHVTKRELLATMDTMMGGRAAEELVFGAERVTSGAASDLQQASALAAQMVRAWGMSDKAGLRADQSDDLGPAARDASDAEVRRLLSDSLERAKAILRAHHKEHRALAQALLEYETLDADDVRTLVSGEKLKHERPQPPAPAPAPAPAAAPSASPAPPGPRLHAPQPAPA